jgi:hypothetical protein
MSGNSSHWLGILCRKAHATRSAALTPPAAGVESHENGSKMVLLILRAIKRQVGGHGKPFLIHENGLNLEKPAPRLTRP